MTVVPFNPPAKTIFVCNCGCASYYVSGDGTVECCLCGEEKQSVFVKDTLKRKTDLDRDCTGVSSVTMYGEIDGARRSVVKGILDKQGEKVLIASIGLDGVVNSWCGADTSKEAAEIAELLRTLASTIENRTGYEPE